MTLRFIDGFDHMASADVLVKWTAGNWSNQPGASMPAGRNSGSQAIQCQGFGSEVFGPKVLDAQDTWVEGIAAYFNALGGVIFGLLDGATLQMDLAVSGTNLIARRAGSTTLGTTSGVTLATGQWYYIEWKVKIHPSAGTVDVHINGTSVLSLTGQNTRASGISSADRIRLGDMSPGSTILTNYYDDFYCCDGQGSGPDNTFLGDVRVYTIMPSGAGNSAQFTPSTGSNYAAVDEAQVNGDTDYIEDSTVGDLDTYVYADIPTGHILYGVQVNEWGKKTGAGTRQIADVARIGGGNYAGGNQRLATSYGDLAAIHPTSPATNSAWSTAEVNAAEFGAKVTV